MMPAQGQAVVTGADNWTPFAAMAHDPVPSRQQASPTQHNLAGSPRGLIDGLLLPGWPIPNCTVTTTTAPKRQGSPQKRKEGGQEEGGAESSSSGRKGEITGEGSRGGTDLDPLQESPVDEQAGPCAGVSSMLRMALRRRASGSGIGPAGRRPSVGAEGSGAMWEDVDEELDLLLGGDEEEEEDSDDEASPKAAPKKRVSQPKKQVGRPLKYKGDPNAPHLTEEERRRIKRRIANRESARRVRQKRNELMEDLQAKCTALSQQNARLLAHASGMEQQNRALMAQVGLLRDKFSVKLGENVQLYNALLHAKRLLMQLQGQGSGELPRTPSLPNHSINMMGSGSGSLQLPPLQGQLGQGQQQATQQPPPLPPQQQQTGQPGFMQNALQEPVPTTSPFCLPLLGPGGLFSSSCPTGASTGPGPQPSPPPLLPLAPPVTSCADPALTLPLPVPSLGLSCGAGGAGVGLASTCGFGASGNGMLGTLPFTSSASSLQLNDLMSLDIPPSSLGALAPPHLLPLQLGPGSGEGQGGEAVKQEQVQGSEGRDAREEDLEAAFSFLG